MERSTDTVCEEWLKELDLFSLVKSMLKDNLIAHLKGSYRDGGAKLLLVVIDDIVRGSSQKL